MATLISQILHLVHILHLYFWDILFGSGDIFFLIFAYVDENIGWHHSVIRLFDRLLGSRLVQIASYVLRLFRHLLLLLMVQLLFFGLLTSLLALAIRAMTSNRVSICSLLHDLLLFQGSNQSVCGR